jgi:hypothetical protein
VVGVDERRAVSLMASEMSVCGARSARGWRCHDRGMMRTVVIVWALLMPLTCWAAPLRVGAGEMFAKPCDAIAAAKAGDVIEVVAGTYNDSCSIAVQGLTLRGVDGRAKIDLSGTDHPAQYKGIYVVDAADVTIENLELTGAHISDDNGANAAGVRVEASGLTVRGCYVHDNQNGILGGTTGTLTVEHTEFADNGLGDGCNNGGCTHNVYVANIEQLNFRFNWSHRVATDTRDKGHLLKSRAKINYILYNRLTGEDGLDSYEIDLPNGGLAIVVGNLIEKGTKSGNPTLFSWGEEGASNPDKRVFIASNTFVNDFGKGTFISAAGAMLVAHDNLLVGNGTPSATGVLSADNLTVDPMFVDRERFDYHLQSGSAAIGKAVDPGSADQFSLVPTSEYEHPLRGVARSGHADVGAYEFGARHAAGSGGETDSSGPIAADGGAAPARRDAGAASDSGAAADGGKPVRGSVSGCGCTIASKPERPSMLTFLLLAWPARRLRRRQRPHTQQQAHAPRRRAELGPARLTPIERGHGPSELMLRRRTHSRSRRLLASTCAHRPRRTCHQE